MRKPTIKTLEDMIRIWRTRYDDLMTENRILKAQLDIYQKIGNTPITMTVALEKSIECVAHVLSDLKSMRKS